MSSGADAGGTEWIPMIAVALQLRGVSVKQSKAGATTGEDAVAGSIGADVERLAVSEGWVAEEGGCGD